MESRKVSSSLITDYNFVYFMSTIRGICLAHQLIVDFIALIKCDCCMLQGRGLCDGPIPHLEEAYRSMSLCSLDTSLMRRPTP
jgi:hypothetical protein